jgi:hypothetical protein
MGFSKLADTVGFDDQRDLLVLSLNQKTNLYLAKFSEQPVSVRFDPQGIAALDSTADLGPAQKTKVGKEWHSVVADPTGKPKDFGKIEDPTSTNFKPDPFGGIGPSPVLAWSGMKKFVVRGDSLGMTKLLAVLPDGTAWQNPTTVLVVSNLNARQVDAGPVSPEFKQELQGMSLGEAVLRVAQDQMNSAYSNNTAGDNRYKLPTGMKKKDGTAANDWCGAFAYWCYQKACDIRGEPNPFGPNNDVLLSPQKAIGFALANPGTFTVVRFQGTSMFFNGRSFDPNKTSKQDQEIDAVPGDNVVPGDICLFRNNQEWRHVCLVKDPGDGDSFVTVDGNQGVPSMKMVLRDFKARLGNGSFQYVFVHLN